MLINSLRDTLIKSLRPDDETLALTTLDAPVTTALAPSTYHAFGFDNMVDGYTGDTVRLKRLSDNAESDFGFNNIGAFDMSAVNSWRSGADVDVVKFYDQKGTAIELLAGGTVAFVRSDAVNRLGVDYLPSTGLLQQSTTEGSVTCDFGVDTGYLYTTETIADPSVNGMEIHTLLQYNERKTALNYLTEFGNGANNEIDYLLSYGVGTSQYFRVQLGGGTNQSIITRLYTGTNASDVLGKYCIRQHSPLIWSMVMDNAYFGILGNGTVIRAKSGTTDLSNGVLDNGKLLVGNFFSTTSGGARTDLMGNMNFSGIILTHRISDLERFTIQAKLNLIAQQHLLKSKAEIEAYFDEIHLMSDVDASGLVVGKKSQTDLQFNKTVGAYNWDFDYDLPHFGLKSIQAIGNGVGDNSFQATNTFLNDITKGTFLSLHLNDANATATDVTQVYGQSSGDPATTSVENEQSMLIGFDHGRPAFGAKIGQDAGSDNLDPDELHGTRRKSDETSFGAAVYDGTNQAQGKYNYKTHHGIFEYGETIDGVVFNQEEWENDPASDWLPNQLDAPVTPNIPENIDFQYKRDIVLFHIGTVENPPEYVFSDAYATRKAHRMKATTYSYVGAGVQPFGTLEGSIARNIGTAAVIHPDSNARIQSVRDFYGARVLFAYSRNVLTQAQINEVQANYYKILEI